MIEKKIKTQSVEYFFENSKETIKMSISLENVNSSDLEKTKKFLETMFQEILKDITY
ncbi:hypothetical protein [Candidatus Stoquefichus massiliensis]|uniref:hypothetical protein n=1 Tax=Candidatus Stoquefichus massiliensis TaxID=1470350 RepID=UPI0004B8EF65|nr:hypothetical protein [Candidatus Stoquefichus massiliensis]